MRGESTRSSTAAKDKKVEIKSLQHHRTRAGEAQVERDFILKNFIFFYFVHTEMMAFHLIVVGRQATVKESSTWLTMISGFVSSFC